uniref:Nudix hydrolase domain-containing protein n=1 Tax=Ciona savignyi TaxID=51511 RepID=H2ZBV6_CIOSA
FALHIQGAVHINSRSPEYPGSKIKRFVVPDKSVSWSVPLPGYNPPQYTSPAVKSQPIWADPPLEPQPTGSTVSLPFNADDKERNVSRKSFTGKYKVVGGLPRNPSGRTGLTGRGLLGRYGPNHAADPVVTRWERDETGTVIKIHGKPVLQFVAICRNDTGEWAIPGGMVDAEENITQTLKREFSEEVLLDVDDQKPGTEIQTQLNKLFNSGVKVYEGYSDDHRNTDISWIETSVFNFHDDNGSTFDRIKLHPGEETSGVQWKRIDQSINLFASHFQFLEKVAKMHNAHF